MNEIEDVAQSVINVEAALMRYTYYSSCDALSELEHEATELMKSVLKLERHYSRQYEGVAGGRFPRAEGPTRDWVKPYA